MPRSNWFKVPTDHVNQRHIIRLSFELGYEGYGILMAFLPYLSDCPDYRMSPDDQIWIARKLLLTPEKFAQFLDSCRRNDALTLHADGSYSSPDLPKWLAEFDKRSSSQARRRSGGAGEITEPQVEDNLTTTCPLVKDKSPASLSDKPLFSSISSSRSNNKKETVYLRFDEIALEQTKCAQGAAVVERAIALAEAHINKKKNTPEFQRLVREAEDGNAFIASWALSEARQQLDKEEAAATRLTRAKAPPKDFEAERKQKQKEEREKWARGEI